jgi:ABC-type uncharacterized transport system permease subunit/mannose-6-phosphate isomerase-like protein (cupin superfamily)
VALLCLGADKWPTFLVIPAAIVTAALAGAAWAFVPAWLQARRGSHVVITTIMFNFIAAALMTHLLVNVLIKPGQQSPETREFTPNTWLPQLYDVFRRFGWEVGQSPLNLSALLALAAGGVVWFYLWHTRWGYELRALGHSETAAVYAGIPPARTIIVAMSISGALAGLLSTNEVMGVQHRLLLNMPGGAGYVGIAVSLMGRNHPVGIVLAAILFGALYQGGSELSFDMPKLTRDMVVVIQGLIILVCGALEHAPPARGARVSAPGGPAFDPFATIVHLREDGGAVPVAWTPEVFRTLGTGDRDRVIGAKHAAEPADVHTDEWEMHPKGDEILYLLTGLLDVVLDEPGGERRVRLQHGQACLVPRGTWHRLILCQPSDLLFITPASGTRHRPVERASTDG